MKLARVNTALLAAIILVNGYIILLPIMPNIIFWVHQDKKQIQHLEQKIHAPLHADGDTTPNKRPTDNRLIVPGMLLDETVHGGPTTATLRKGLWHRPLSSSPDKGSNTVIVGHRLTYNDPQGTLYHLDKVHVGDGIAVWWDGKRYLYTVTETKVVKPSEIGIEAPTTDSRLTIYTCTPLWLPKDRLVVIASLQEVE